MIFSYSDLRRFFEVNIKIQSEEGKKELTGGF